MAEMAKMMWQKERIAGFFKGYTTTLYGSVAYGGLYFATYRIIKHKLGELTSDSQLGQVQKIIVSALLAETLALLVYYPFEMVKVRFLSKPEKYGYQSVFDSFRKIHTKQSFWGFYKGATSYYLNCSISYTLSMTIYELITMQQKLKLGNEKYQANEVLNVLQASLCSGLVTALLTNSMEVIVIRRQDESTESIIDMFKNERGKMFTKGLGVRMLNSGIYSCFFYLLINRFGRLFDTTFEE